MSHKQLQGAQYKGSIRPEGAFIEFTGGEPGCMALFNSGTRLVACVFLLDLDKQFDWVKPGEATVSLVIGTSLKDAMRKVSTFSTEAVHTGDNSGARMLLEKGHEFFRRDVVPYLQSHGAHATVHVGSPGKKISEIVLAIPEMRGDREVWYGEF